MTEIAAEGEVKYLIEYLSRRVRELEGQNKLLHEANVKYVMTLREIYEANYPMFSALCDISQIAFSQDEMTTTVEAPEIEEPEDDE